MQFYLKSQYYNRNKNISFPKLWHYCAIEMSGVSFVNFFEILGNKFKR